jgi:hypothetical protein
MLISTRLDPLHTHAWGCVRVCEVPIWWFKNKIAVSYRLPDRDLSRNSLPNRFEFFRTVSVSIRPPMTCHHAQAKRTPKCPNPRPTRCPSPPRSGHPVSPHPNERPRLPHKIGQKDRVIARNSSSIASGLFGVA